MKKIYLIILMLIASLIVFAVAVGLGSVPIPPQVVISIITEKYLGFAFVEDVSEVTKSIVLNVRLSRVTLAYLSGMGLAVSGVLMQSVLRNPLASSITLGVSSGASLGASIAILLNISIFGIFTLPTFGLVFGLLTVFLALGIASKIDKNFQNNSIILMGTAFSLFGNAIITILMSLAKDNLQTLIYWQMGSFAMRDKAYIGVLTPFITLGIIASMYFANQLDILSLGDEQAQTTGVNAKNLKWFALSLGAILTGAIISIVGIIGFVDLFTPHVARKFFGASHKYVIPVSAILGGTFMVLCDLLARIVAQPLEIPVGAITAMIGAPFFIYLYYSKRV